MTKGQGGGGIRAEHYPKTKQINPEQVRPYDTRLIPAPVPDTDLCDCPHVVLCLNSEWASHLDGLLERLLYRDAWAGTDEDKDRAVATIERLLSMFKVSDMCCCGEEKLPLQYRYTPVGKLEISDDGGITWRDGSAYDARNQVPVYPPPQTLPADSECLYAENIADEVKRQVEIIINTLQSGGTVAGAASALLPLLVALGLPAAPLAAFLILVYGLISVIVSLIAAGVQNSFDSTFWGEFKCMWYCVINPDGEVTDGTIEQVKLKVADYFTASNPLATKTIQDTIGMLGAKALTNAARMGDSILNSDCENCDCDPEWCYEFDFLTANGSFQNVSGSNYGNWLSGQGWVSELVGGSGGQSVWIKRDFTSVITRVEIDVTWTNTTGRNIQVNTQDTALISDVGGAPLSHTFTWDGLRSATQLVLNPSGGTGNVVRITRLLIRGEGTNPFGTDNCP